MNIGATCVTHEGIDFLVYATINHTESGDVDLDISGIYLVGDPFERDLLEMLSEDVVSDLTSLVLAVHGYD